MAFHSSLRKAGKSLGFRVYNLGFTVTLQVWMRLMMPVAAA